jgi:hypothetical protein
MYFAEITPTLIHLAVATTSASARAARTGTASASLEKLSVKSEQSRGF